MTHHREVAHLPDQPQKLSPDRPLGRITEDRAEIDYSFLISRSVELETLAATSSSNRSSHGSPLLYRLDLGVAAEIEAWPTRCSQEVPQAFSCRSRTRQRRVMRDLSSHRP